MKDNFRRNKKRAVYMTPEEKKKCAGEIEKKYPGYLDENLKLRKLVEIMTGLRALYGLLYMYICYLFDINIAEGVAVLAQALFFMCWFLLMLRSSKILTVAMLLLRGYAIVQSAVGIILTAHYMPFTVIFIMVLSVVLEFCAAVFCIYLLFNKKAAETVQLNIMLERGMFRLVSDGSLEREAGYQNPYTNEGKSEEYEETAEKKEEEEENKADFT